MPALLLRHIETNACGRAISNADRTLSAPLPGCALAAQRGNSA